MNDDSPDRMSEPSALSLVRIGIIICHRYHACAGGKCLRAIRQREGAFAAHKDRGVVLVGYTTCGGCPGGNIEYAPEEMKKNGIDVIHLATGLLVGYPPCPHIVYYRRFVTEKFGIPVVVGTHPIPQKYFLTHRRCESWNGPAWEERLQPVLADESTRLAYD